MRLLPKSLVGRNALFLTVILILNNVLWFELVRPAVYERYVQPYQIYHPKGILRFLVDVEWALFALLVCTFGVYIIFYWLRRQLQSLIGAARILGDGRMPPPLPETGPEEIRELSRGFNQLAQNLEALESDRRLMLVGISHDLSTPLTRLRLAIELMQMKPDMNQVPGIIQDIEEMNGILVQFADYAKTGKDEEPVLGDFNQVVVEVCQRYVSVGKAVRWDLAKIPAFNFRALAVRRLVTNLVDNAARYGRGEIEVNTRHQDGIVTLTVLDQGPGIRSMDPNSLIKPFARENIARGTQLGAGLGLSIVDRIAKTHGGDLVLSNRPEAGLAVTVTIQAGP
ncbi:MAG TPA: ATP-binding protein [Steroidobacteraceae bacterium]|jgi:two-component system osmolarity sensor histidine kinase EnvZ|nr:ATP-binding protein [Steroidobacteraceae bacterium]